MLNDTYNMKDFIFITQHTASDVHIYTTTQRNIFTEI